MLSAVVGHAVADPDVDGTASGVIAAARQAVVGAVVRDAFLVAAVAAVAGRAADPAYSCPAVGTVVAAFSGASLVVHPAAYPVWLAFRACPAFCLAALASAFRSAALAVRRQKQGLQEAATELLC